jgi:hypothetical protein
MDWVTALGDGHCGLSDGSAPGEWVLPDPPALAHVQAAIASGAFVDVVDTFYWTDYWLDDFCGAVFMPAGNMELRGWAEQHLAWPVRLR